MGASGFEFATSGVRVWVRPAAINETGYFVARNGQAGEETRIPRDEPPRTSPHSIHCPTPNGRPRQIGPGATWPLINLDHAGPILARHAGNPASRQDRREIRGCRSPSGH